MTARASLGELLLAKAGLSREKLEQAETVARTRGQPLERAVVALNLADEGAVWRCLAEASGMPFADPAKAKIGPELLGRIPREQIEEHGALPVLQKDGRLFVAIDDPLKSWVGDNLAFLAGCEVRCVLAPPNALREAIRRTLGGMAPERGSKGAGPADGAADRDDPDAPIIRLVHRTIEEAVDARASDIHIEPFEQRMRVRLRIDGVLRETASLERELHGALTSRLKIMAGLDIAEKRKPQDGRIDFRTSQRRAIDIRTSVLPGNHGETIVMRLLDKERNLLSLEALGFGCGERARFDRLLKRPNGIILVTGPTGSGKTTTLYAALRDLNRSDVKIITAEDPVEFNIAGINQCQVRTRIGLGFARILRAMLRQAPNVILVGEIRDRETAEIAVQAALTGHLVFSTLHTNDAPSAVTRLTDMGVKPFLVAAGVQAILAQRLVRVLCEACKQPYAPTPSELRTLGLEATDTETKLFRAVGCDACDQTGYRGRLGIFELLEMDTTIREMTFRGEPLEHLRAQARAAGMTNLYEDGVRKVVGGRTTLDELLRVTASG